MTTGVFLIYGSKAIELYLENPKITPEALAVVGKVRVGICEPDQISGFIEGIVAAAKIANLDLLVISKSIGHIRSSDVTDAFAEINASNSHVATKPHSYLL